MTGSKNREMKKLAQFGFKKGWIYEAVVATGTPAAAHAAPIGVWTNNFNTVCATIYKGSKTLANVLVQKNFSVNLPSDAGVIFAALYHRDRLSFAAAETITAPVIIGASAHLEVTLRGIAEGEKTLRVEGDIVAASGSIPVRLINRAEALVLENLVLSTKRPHFQAGAIDAAIRENHRVIRKVAPDSEHEKVSAMLMKTLGLG